MATLAATFVLPRGAPAAKKGGSLSPPAPLSCGAPLRQASGDTRGATSLRFSAADAENPVVSRLMRRFREVPPTTARALPSEREALCVAGSLPC